MGITHSFVATGGGRLVVDSDWDADHDFDGPITLAGAVGSSALTITGGTQTASFPALSITQTWNNAGVTFTGAMVNVTDTTSAAASILLDLQVAGATKLNVTKAGKVVSAVTGGTIIAGGTSERSAFRDVDANTSSITAGGVVQAYFRSATDTNASLLLERGLGWPTASGDVFITRDAANTLAQRRTTNAQTFRVYTTYTDASNYERAALQTGAGYVELAAETAGTGTDNLDVRITPAGTGTVRFGAHSAIAAETVTGYITITDSGGTVRKLAVVS